MDGFIRMLVLILGAVGLFKGLTGRGSGASSDFGKPGAPSVTESEHPALRLVYETILVIVLFATFLLISEVVLLIPVSELTVLLLSSGLVLLATLMPVDIVRAATRRYLPAALVAWSALGAAYLLDVKPPSSGLPEWLQWYGDNLTEFLVVIAVVAVMAMAVSYAARRWGFDDREVRLDRRHAVQLSAIVLIVIAALLQLRSGLVASDEITALEGRADQQERMLERQGDALARQARALKDLADGGGRQGSNPP